MVAEKLAGLKREDTLKQYRSDSSKDETAISRTQAAATMGVSTKSVDRAREVRQAAPDRQDRPRGDPPQTPAFAPR